MDASRWSNSWGVGWSSSCHPFVTFTEGLFGVADPFSGGRLPDYSSAGRRQFAGDLGWRVRSAIVDGHRRKR